MLNPPEKKKMELSKACPQGAHSQMGARQGAEATNPFILREAEDTGSGGPGSEGAQQRGIGLDRRVERARKTSWRRRQISRGFRTSGID